jgi:extracellular factor (EF) 3-hydroxypalmitic acid methyl ester biosynthesis protein
MKDYVFSNQPAVRKLIQFIQAGGPEETEYEEMTSIWDSLIVDTQPSVPDGQSRDRLLDLFGEEFLSQTIQGWSYRKPYGYAGDFEIIDFIYQHKIIADARFQKWDKYLHSLHATRAVRNRKDYFIQLVKDGCSKAQRQFRVLNIASGPCRDVLELFQVVSPEKVKLHCVDLDPNAIQYAKKLLGNFSEAVEFSRANIFKFDTTEKFDLVWSAGLFDYFDDENFIKVLSKLYSWCAPKGEVVIGNFSVENPTRSYMEKAYDWYLFHRTEEQLKTLASKVSLVGNHMEVKSEPLKVNLFLHMKRNCPATCKKNCPI